VWTFGSYDDQNNLEVSYKFDADRAGDTPKETLDKCWTTTEWTGAGMLGGRGGPGGPGGSGAGGSDGIAVGVALVDGAKVEEKG
jgi:hypothetical protein